MDEHKFLAWLRQKHGVSQYELAKRTGKSYSLIQKIEQGTRNLDASMRRDILAALGVMPESLASLRQRYTVITEADKPI